MLQITDIPLNSIYLNNEVLPLYATHYVDDQAPPKATLIYLHGGGLLCGSRLDLPKLHQQFFTQAGFQIIALDYPLAPHFDVETILDTLLESIKNLKNSPHFQANFQPIISDLPLFLWGRSAGAYLALLIGSKISALSDFPKISGILSFYGYGFLSDSWFETPSPYYLALPKIDEMQFNRLTQQISANTESSHFATYIYARQTGKWKSLIYQGRDKFFYLDYSLRLSTISIPILAVHSTGDPDVPFSEFNVLCEKFNPSRFVVASEHHDFDRDETSTLTQELLETSLNFLHKHLSV